MLASLPLLLETQQLFDQLDDPSLLIIDLGKGSVYEQAHVPGAVPLDFNLLQSGEQPTPGMLPSTEALSALFSSLGLTPDKTVIAYDDEGGGWASRLLWMLEIIGHEHFCFLNGGIHAWLADGLPTESGETPAKPSGYNASPYNVETLNPQPMVTLDYLLKNHQREDLVLWDARAEEEYTGLRAYARRGGHIPGAIHYEWTQPMDKNRQLRLRDPEIIRQELTEKGITADKEIIVYCQTHHRSSYSWLVGKVLGFDNIRGYPGSWAEWGNHPDTPVEKDIQA